ncbi:MAG TPA: ABC transporter permease [Gemmatimonadales bacterium]|jgi:putative ABC transport system permease protein
MSLWRQVTRGFRVLMHRDQADRELRDEAQQFIDAASADAVSRGTAPDEARRNARLAFGSTGAIREEVRSHGWEERVASLIADVRYAARGMAHRPGFALAAILTLAIGIGASTAIFSAVDPILFAPLPYPHADRVVMLSDRNASGAPIAVTYGTYLEIAARAHSFSAVAIADRWQPALTQPQGDPERLTGDLVSTGYFPALGVSPAIGRDFTSADDVIGAPRVVIITDALARLHFGDPRSALGRAIILDGDPFTVIGVMPRTFDNYLAPRAQLWTTRRYRSNASFQSPEWGHHERMVGRLVNGVTPAIAQREVTAIGATPQPAFQRPPWAAMASGLTLESLQAAITRDVRPALLAVLAAVALLLMIAAVNVANLLLARGAQRRSELALRATLGAGRGRLVRQLLTESVLLAMVGGIAGLGIAAIGVRALVSLAPADLPRVGAIRLDTTALLFALVLTSIVGLLVGIAPALQGARPDLHSDIRSGARTTGVTHPSVRRVLVTAEVALALMVLVGAGLMLRSLTRLFSIAPGFNAQHLLTMQVEAAGHQYDSASARYQFFTSALDAVRAVPGVTDAAFTSLLPLSGDLDTYGFRIESIALADANAGHSALRYNVSPSWFHTMGIPLLRGRLLDAGDRPGNGESVVISASMAKSEFGGADPIGQHFRAGPEIGDTTRPWAVVVGVVGDVKQASLADDGGNAFYGATGQWPWIDGAESIAVRTTADPAALVPAVERAIWSVDRNQPIIRVATMEQLLDRSEAQRHFVLTVFMAFGLTALVLAAIGVFGLISGSVTERISEIGVRTALGASRGNIVLMVLRQGMTLAGVGVVIGIAGGAAVSGILRTFLFGIGRTDVVTFAAASVLVLGVAVAASAIPAWRAGQVDPAQTLRG